MFGKVCETRNRYIFFGNGMFTDIVQASRTLSRLRLKHDRLRHPPVYMRLSYNLSEPLIIQLAQVVRQKSMSVVDVMLDVFSEKIGKSLNRDVVSVFQAYVERQKMDATLANHMTEYEAILTERLALLDIPNTIVVVAHSQGNFYANFAYSKLRNRIENLDGKMQIVSVANPAHEVAGMGPYITFHSDMIVRFIPFSLPGNSHKKQESLLNHSFLEDYYRETEQKDEIDKFIDSFFEKNHRNWKDLEDPAPECKQWFNDLNINKESLSGCQVECFSSKVDMGTFECPASCETLCCQAVRAD